MSQASNRFGTWGVHAAGIGFCLASTLGVWAALVAPQLRSEARAEQLSAEHATDLHQVRVLNAELAELREAQSDLDRRLDSIQMAAAAGQGLNARVSRVIEIAEETGFAVDVLQPMDSSQTAYVTQTPIRLEGRGSFPACVLILERLHATCPDIQVLGFDFTKQSGQVTDQVRGRLSLMWNAPRTQPGS